MVESLPSHRYSVQLVARAAISVNLFVRAHRNAFKQNEYIDSSLVGFFRAMEFFNTLAPSCVERGIHNGEEASFPNNSLHTVLNWNN